MDFLLLPLGVVGFTAFSRWLIASPTRMARIERQKRAMPDGPFLLGICFMIGLPIGGVASEAQRRSHELVASWVGWFGVAWLLLGLLLLIFPIPVPRWLVPKVYRNDTEHVYCRPVIGLKRVETLSAAPDRQPGPN